jgi:hypothetical protein
MSEHKPARDLLEELMAIRRSLSSAAPGEKSVPLLDEVVQGDGIESPPLPLLSDKVLEPLPEQLDLARRSWQDIREKMFAWAGTLAEPQKTFVLQWLRGMQRPMENAWEALFSELNEEQRLQWQDFYQPSDQD